MKKTSSIKRLLSAVKGYRLQTILTPIFMIGEVVGECLIPFLMAKFLLGHLEAVNKGIATLNWAHLLLWSGILVLCAIVSLIFGSLAGITAAKAGAGFAKNLRRDLYYSIQNYSFKNIDNFSSASLVTRLTTDVTNVQMAFMMTIRMAVRAPMMMIVSTIFATRIYPKAGLVYLISVPFLLIALGIIMIRAVKIFNKIFKKYDALNNSVQENVKAMRVVKAYVREDYEKQKFFKSAEDVKLSFEKAEKITALNAPAMMLAMHGTTTAILFLCANAGINGAGFNVANLSALVTYSTQLLMSFMMLSMVFVMITIAFASIKRVLEVLEETPTIVSPENAVLEVFDGSVEFENVSFKYSQTAEKFALKTVSLKINAGETVGILGATGSSKTSLISLIPRLYDATEGTVKVGGVNVKDYDLKTLRDAVSVVLQKNELFSGTIYENIRWGDENATDEEVVKACKMACADEFISTFPDGYNTKIEQGGTNVSGGQKQRLCIARAILKKPKILIFDDSTSAVDTKTDALIRLSIKNEIPNTTKIIIAQRVASVQDADKIIILENGEINAIGTHDELLNSNAIYQEVYYSQNKITNKGVN
ncbi:MAG: ABC transporter ATP-binding protein [Clostridia bacterium]|nr:ABC transporter ATP-binding protein [Clostridia bacterium]